MFVIKVIHFTANLYVHQSQAIVKFVVMLDLLISLSLNKPNTPIELSPFYLQKKKKKCIKEFDRKHILNQKDKASVALQT
jgi:hypothetical protein